MSFFMTHSAFTFCLVACFFGTIIHAIAPFFSEDYLFVNGRSFNLGTLGVSIFIQPGFLVFVINLLLATPGLLLCERFYGSEITLAAVLFAGFFSGMLGLLFDKHAAGFTGVAILLDVMASFYGFHWWGILIGIVIVISAFCTDSSAEKENRTAKCLAVLGIVLAFVNSSYTGTAPKFSVPSFDKPSISVPSSDNQFICPLPSSYRLTSGYGNRIDPATGRDSFHKGIDMACAEGTAIKASNGGTIVATGYDNTYGNYVVIDHGNGYKTKYAHMKNVSVKDGSYVNQGQPLGTVGSTGYSTGPHLHFMVFKNGKEINPKTVLN